MKNKLTFILLPILLITLVACDSHSAEEIDTNLEELATLEVELDVPTDVDVDETVPMNAQVIYGDEDVVDADDVTFEIWEEGKDDESDKIEATNNEDGSYSVETTFDQDGLFHVQVHVTAHDLHTMPRKEVTVGEGGEYDEDTFETDGFDMHVMEPEDVKMGEETKLITHVQIVRQPLKEAILRHEVDHYDEENKPDWVQADETSAGEYTGTYTFDSAGTSTIEIHVEDDEDLHENTIIDVDVKK